MKLDIQKNAIRTMSFGVVNKVIMIVLPFIVRTIMIKELGLEYVGIGSLFTSILQVLSLTELGFGSAMVFNMYKPIAENDTEKICKLLNFYKNVYRLMGIIVLTIGMITFLFLDMFISADVPEDINIRLLFVLYLLNTVIGYFTYAYKSSLLFAHQRYDIYNNVLTILNVINYIYQAFALIFFKNYYMYIITMPVVTVLLNFISAAIVKKEYPTYVPKGNLSLAEKKDIGKRVLALAGHRIGGVLTNSFDNIVISSFLGFYMLGKYNNYYYIITSLNGFIVIATNALTAGIGNQVARENKEKVRTNFMEITALFCWAVGWCCICLICITQIFITIWVGEGMLLSISVVLRLALYFYLYNTRYIISIYKDANGMWGSDVLKPYCEGFVALAINIYMIKNFGINGVMVAPIITMGLIGMPWETHVLFKGYFVDGEVHYWMRRLEYLMVAILAGIPTYLICSKIEATVSGLLLCGVVCVIIPNLIYCAVSSIAFKEFRDILSRLVLTLRRKKQNV